MESQLFGTLINLLQTYPLCPECLGRQFSMLSTGMSNSIRSSSLLNSLLMEIHNCYYLNPGTEEFVLNGTTYNIPSLLRQIYNNTSFNSIRLMHKQLYHEELPALSDFKCKICQNLLCKPFLDRLVDEVIIKLRGYELSHFLAGSVFPASFNELEDELRVKFGITTGEVLKTNFNRVFGIILSRYLGVGVEFNNPDVLIVIKLESESNYAIDLQSNPVYIQGRYLKYARGIPQTHWTCRECQGLKYNQATREPCEYCGGKGYLYDTSVEQEISPSILKLAQGTESKFHGAGREDRDARCLGNGRPFIVEIKQPRNRFLDLKLITDLVNQSDKVFVADLQFASRKTLQSYKVEAENRSKSYRALTEINEPISEDEFYQKLSEAKQKLVGKVINQRTPLRVVHRRADIVRKKKILGLEGVYIDHVHCVFYITAQGGTYIKELISGDEFRTSPNLAAIFGIPLKCAELDIMSVN